MRVPLCRHKLSRDYQEFALSEGRKTRLEIDITRMETAFLRSLVLERNILSACKLDRRGFFTSEGCLELSFGAAISQFYALLY